jgi:hypothetical protein
MNVQHWSDEDADVRENEYEGIICPACTRLHFLNRKTGKLLGQDGDRSARLFERGTDQSPAPSTKSRRWVEISDDLMFVTNQG